MAGVSHLSRRFVEGMSGWLALRRLLPEAGMDTASELVDKDGNAHWMASYRVTDRLHEGIERMPNYVVTVAPSGGKTDALESDELLVRTYELQRMCAALSSELATPSRVGSRAKLRSFSSTSTRTARIERALAYLHSANELASLRSVRFKST